MGLFIQSYLTTSRSYPEVKDDPKSKFHTIKTEIRKRLKTLSEISLKNEVILKKKKEEIENLLYKKLACSKTTYYLDILIQNVASLGWKNCKFLRVAVEAMKALLQRLIANGTSRFPTPIAS